VGRTSVEVISKTVEAASEDPTTLGEVVVAKTWRQT
jgi:hypothetical protein